jgi:hypothetical protein
VRTRFDAKPKIEKHPLADSRVKARLTEQGGLMPMTPVDFAKHIAAETEKWGKVIRTANIKVIEAARRRTY